MEELVNNLRYTYNDYEKWEDGVRYELIDGFPYMMSSPSMNHQRLIGRLFVQFWMFLQGKSCEVFLSPFDVRLNADEGDNIVVQPDLVIVCDRSKLNGKCCVGAPDMLIEVLSPSSSKLDKHIKLQKYQKYGVREYWIVDPDSNTIQAFTLANGLYIIKSYSDEDIAPVGILDGCEINLKEVFAEL